MNQNEPPDFSAETRQHNLARFSQQTFDLLVIGGGITGAGIAHLAARRGYSVALVEKDDFASGASSKSSKLVHGGLRYLATADYELVFQASRQRRKLRRLAPHLVWPMPFVLPVYQDSANSWLKTIAGMWLYDALATFRNIKPHQLWSARRALKREPLLNPEGLVGAARYFDCGTDDARLTLANLVAAHRQGAVIANQAQVKGLLQTAGRVVGAQVTDRLGGAEFEVQAEVVVSAAGPWTDAVLGRSGAARWLRPTKGIHLVVPRQRVPSQSALAFTSPRDGRFLYLIPWHGRTLIGTTETGYQEDPDEVCATAEDVAYLLEAAWQAFPSARLTDSDVVSTFAGLRPLIDEAAVANYQVSREHHVAAIKPGLIAIAGGKLTTYREMAEDVLEEVARHVRLRRGRPRARFNRRLPGGDMGRWARFQARAESASVAAAALPEDVAAHLVATYGSEAPQVLSLLGGRPELAERLTAELPVIQLQVVYATRHEMAVNLVDVLDRRTHLLALARDQGLAAAEPVAQVMAAELGWTPEVRAAQIAQYQRQVALSRRWRRAEA